MRKYIYIIGVAITLLLASCSGDAYLNAIPQGSTALISIDVAKSAEETGKTTSADVLKQLLRVTDVSDCGIDLSEKLYLFEAPDGNLGLAAKVSDDDDLSDWLNKMSKEGVCKPVQKRRGKSFTVLKQSWVVAFSDEALLMMGPVVASAQTELMSQMVKYLDAEEGIKGTPMFDRLSEMSSAVAMVAQAQALPEKFISLFTVGAPTDTDPSEVLIAAEMHAKDGCLLIDGKTFSFDENINKALQTSSSVYRPLNGTFFNQIPEGSLFSLMMNVDGKKYLPMMKADKQLRGLLAGIGVKIDIDKFIEGVDGDLVFVVPRYSEENMEMRWAAQLSATAPELDTESKDELAKCELTATTTPLPASLQAMLKGKRMCALFDLTSVEGDKKEVIAIATTLLKPLFGDVKYVVYGSKE